MAGLLAEGKGPKRKSKLTADTVAAIRRLREVECPTARRADIGVSQGSVRTRCLPMTTRAPRKRAPQRL